MSTMKDLARIVADRHDLPRQEAEQFLADMFDLLKSGLTADEQVKIKGLGTFKVQTMQERKSVNVNTGEEIIIDSHERISFTPDASMKESVNKPFAHFETVPINDGVVFEDIEDLHADNLADKPEPVAESKPEPVVESKPEPVVESNPEPVVETKPEPVAESNPEPVVETKPELVAVPVQPVAAPVVEPVEEPVVPTVVPMPESRGREKSENYNPVLSLALEIDDVSPEIAKKHNISSGVAPLTIIGEETEAQQNPVLIESADDTEDKMEMVAVADAVEAEMPETAEEMVAKITSETPEEAMTETAVTTMAETPETTVAETPEEITEDNDPEVQQEVSEEPSEEPMLQPVAEAETPPAESEVVMDAETAEEEDVMPEESPEPAVADVIETEVALAGDETVPEPPLPLTSDMETATTAEADPEETLITSTETPTIIGTEESSDKKQDNTTNINMAYNSNIDPSKDNDKIGIGMAMLLCFLVLIVGIVIGRATADITFNDLKERIYPSAPEPIEDTVKVTAITDSVTAVAGNIGTEAASGKNVVDAAAEKAEAEKKAAAEKAEVEKKAAAEKAEAEKKAAEAKAKAAEAGASKYDSDPRVRLGAYRIVGVQKTVTVKAGQTLASISKTYLGPGMECYVEAVNGVKDVQEGQQIKIPELALKKKKN